MNGIYGKIEATDFGKAFRRLVIITLAVFIACGALTALMFRTQLKELAALESTEEQTAHRHEDARLTEERGYDDEERDETDVFEAAPVTRPPTAAMITVIASITLCGLCVLAYWLMTAAWPCKAS